LAFSAARRARPLSRPVTAGFDAVFGVFLLSMLIVAVLAVRWGVRRDRAERARRADAGADAGTAASRPPAAR
jgi:hypothetical protein